MGNNNNRNNNRNNGKGQQKPKLKRYKGKNVDPMSGTVQMTRHAGRVFLDIAHGNFRLDSSGALFHDRNFVLAAINEAEARMLDQQIYCTSLNYTYGGTTDVNVMRLMEKHRRSLEGWTMIRETMIGILNTGDMGLLLGLMSRLPDYRYTL